MFESSGKHRSFASGQTLNKKIMEQLNRIELRGTVGSVRYQSFGDNSVANFTLVTNYAYKDREGAPVIETTWHNISAWEGKEIQNVSEIVKGSKVYICGRLHNRSYTGADGTDHFITEVVARRVALISGDDLACEMI